MAAPHVPLRPLAIGLYHDFPRLLAKSGFDHPAAFLFGAIIVRRMFHHTAHLDFRTITFLHTLVRIAGELELPLPPRWPFASLFCRHRRRILLLPLSFPRVR